MSSTTTVVLDTWLLIRYFDDDERAASAVQRLQRPDNGVMPLASAVTLGEVYKALVKTEGVRASDRPAVQTLAPSPTGTLPGQLVVSAAVDRSWPVPLCSAVACRSGRRGKGTHKRTSRNCSNPLKIQAGLLSDAGGTSSPSAQSRAGASSRCPSLRLHNVH